MTIPPSSPYADQFMAAVRDARTTPDAVNQAGALARFLTATGPVRDPAERAADLMLAAAWMAGRNHTPPTATSELTVMALAGEMLAKAVAP